MSSLSPDKNYEWKDVSNSKWGLDRITWCRRKRRALRLLKGVGYVVVALVLFGLYYYLRLYAKTGIDFEKITGGILTIKISEADTAYVLALFSGFILAKVYKSPKKILEHLIPWKDSWKYHYSCIENLLKDVEKFSRFTPEQKKKFEIASQTLFENMDILRNKNEWRKTKDPYKKLQKLIELVIEKLNSS